MKLIAFISVYFFSLNINTFDLLISLAFGVQISDQFCIKGRRRNFTPLFENLTIYPIEIYLNFSKDLLPKNVSLWVRGFVISNMAVDCREQLQYRARALSYFLIGWDLHFCQMIGGILGLKLILEINLDGTTCNLFILKYLEYSIESN